METEILNNQNAMDLSNQISNSNNNSNIDSNEMTPNKTTNNNINPQNNNNTSTNTPTSPTNNSDIELPMSIVTKIIKESLPQGVIISKDCRLAIAKAASIFVLYTTATANNLVMENKRKTLRDMDVLTALEEMDFGEMVPKLKEALEVYKESNRSKKQAAAERKKQANAEQANQKQTGNSELQNNSTNDGNNNNNEMQDQISNEQEENQIANGSADQLNDIQGENVQ